MLLAESVSIEADDTTGRLQDRLASLGGRLIVQALSQLDRLRPEPQPGAGVSYAAKIDKAEAHIDWAQSAEVIERKLRAFDPQPGCHFEWQGHNVKLWRAVVVGGTDAPPGTISVSKDQLQIACGQGALQVTELQWPGGRRMAASSFLASRR
jgi:methionyl-tRNA formyltransferase